ncbi:MAG: sigma-70 family RNA polymerase sigma factor [Polyangiaceae bacterium]
MMEASALALSMEPLRAMSVRSQRNAIRDAQPSLEFASVFRQHAPFAWRCLRRLGVASGDCDDVCQDVFLVVHRKLGELSSPDALRAWIYGICVRKASDYRRSARRRHEELSDAPPDRTSDAPPGPERQVAGKQALERLDRALAELDEDKRAAFVLYEIEGLTLQEVALACDTPLQTVYSRLGAARKHVLLSLGEPAKLGKEGS